MASTTSTAQRGRHAAPRTWFSHRRDAVRATSPGTGRHRRGLTVEERLDRDIAAANYSVADFFDHGDHGVQGAR